MRVVISCWLIKISLSLHTTRRKAQITVTVVISCWFSKISLSQQTQIDLFGIAKNLSLTQHGVRSPEAGSANVCAASGGERSPPRPAWSASGAPTPGVPAGAAQRRGLRCWPAQPRLATSPASRRRSVAGRIGLSKRGRELWNYALGVPIRARCYEHPGPRFAI